jgi:hypothetical protein
LIIQCKRKNLRIEEEKNKSHFSSVYNSVSGEGKNNVKSVFDEKTFCQPDIFKAFVNKSLENEGYYNIFHEKNSKIEIKTGENKIKTDNFFIVSMNKGEFKTELNNMNVEEPETFLKPRNKEN